MLLCNYLKFSTLLLLFPQFPYASGHILCYLANIVVRFAERAKEKIKSVVNMYGINSVQSLMAQMYSLSLSLHESGAFFVVPSIYMCPLLH